MQHDDKHREHSATGDRASGDQAPCLVPGRFTLVQQVPAAAARHASPRRAPVQCDARSFPGRRGTIQMLSGDQRDAGVPADGEARVHAAAARGIATPATALPYLAQIQRSFGRHDISGVKAHVGAEASASAQAMGARAYATGDHVVLGAGADLHTVAHEAAHVVQQRGGVQLKSGVGEVGRVRAERRRGRGSRGAGRAGGGAPGSPRPRVEVRLPGGGAAFGRAVQAADRRQHDHQAQHVCAVPAGTPEEQFYDEWRQLTSSEREALIPLIEHPDERGRGATFREVLESVGREKEEQPHQGSLPTIEVNQAPRTETILGPSGPITLKVLNQSGGYHAILEHPMSPYLVIRARKDRKATPIDTGLENCKKLDKELREVVGEAIRTPGVMAFSEQAYIVERITSSVDAWAMWQELKGLKGKDDHDSQARVQLLQGRLHAIATIMQENIRAMYNGKTERFPDFRPDNVGQKDGAPELIYIDFDQTGEIQERATIVDHVMQWAGRRYQLDRGGARDPDPELYKFISGGMLS